MSVSVWRRAVQWKQVVTALRPPSSAAPPASRKFTQFAWLILAWNAIVVLWGAYVRATGSGAGCGSHWPLCNGEVVPVAPAAKTVIEFTHRMTSGLALIGVVVLVVWAWRAFPKHHAVRRYAGLSLFFILIEALLGAGLVLLQYVENNASVGRAIYLSAHLVNTQILLGVLTLAAWFSRSETAGQRFRLGSFRIWGVLPFAMVVGVSGAIAALGDTLFPASSLSEGLRQELSGTAHFLVRLRVFHPALAILMAIYVSFTSLAVIKAKLRPSAVTLAWWIWGVTALQVALGFLNVLLLAPVWMQLTHLFVADIMWVLLVLLVAENHPAR